MVKMLFGFGVGAALAAGLFLGPFQAASTNAEETPPVSGNNTEIDLSSLDIKLMLTTAGEEIQTPDTRRYYDTLMGRYHIDEFPTPTMEALTVDPVSLLPDIDRIAASAITTPLMEAGRAIQDPDLARFYWKLLGDSGWNLTPE